GESGEERGYRGAVVPDGDQAIRIFIREPLEQHGVDYGENGGVRPDAQRQSRDDDGGYARISRKQAQGEAEIFEHLALIIVGRISLRPSPSLPVSRLAGTF